MKKILVLIALFAMLFSVAGVLAVTTTGTSLTISGSAVSEISSSESTSSPNSAHLEADNITAYPPSNEGRVRINFASGTSLGDINSISWMQKVIEGYAAHVDVLVDTNSDGTSDDALVFEYAKVNTSNCDISANYPTIADGWINTFDDNGIVDDNAYAWLSSGPPGPCGDSSFEASHKKLSTWKSDNPSWKVIAMEIEVDGWISTNLKSEAYIDDIKINGNLVQRFEPVSNLTATVCSETIAATVTPEVNFGSVIPGKSYTLPNAINITSDASTESIMVSVSGVTGDLFNGNLKLGGSDPLTKSWTFTCESLTDCVCSWSPTSATTTPSLIVPDGFSAGSQTGAIVYLVTEA